MERLLQNPRRLPPTGKGQEDSALPFLSPGLVLQGGSQDLTPNCSEVRHGLNHPLLGPTPGLAQ